MTAAAPVVAGDAGSGADPVPVGAVLVGGASRRMGRPKAWLPVDGVPMADRVAAALAAAGCTPILFVGSSPAPAGVRDTVHDRFPGDGPVGGVITAMVAAAERSLGASVVVAACDLPWLDADVVRSLLVEGRARPDAHVVAAMSDGRHVPLACWRPGALRHLQHSFDGGERSWRGALDGLRVLAVEIPARSAADVDSPQDLRSSRSEGAPRPR